MNKLLESFEADLDALVRADNSSIYDMYYRLHFRFVIVKTPFQVLFRK